MISAGVLILIAIIAYVAMSRKSNNTSPTTDISPETPSIQGGAKKLYKSWRKSLNKLLKTKIF